MKTRKIKTPEPTAPVAPEPPVPPKQEEPKPAKTGTGFAFNQKPPNYKAPAFEYPHRRD